ncbi:MAG: FAD-dependent monooxygenase [Acidobacteriota bacterium]
MNTKSKQRAIIIGGGIGGLCAAIALKRKGIDVTVFEKTCELQEVGAGLSLWLNAIKALDKIGLTQALQALSIPQVSGGVRNSKGALLSSAFNAETNEKSEPLIIVLHRAELLAALLKTLGEENVKLNAQCIGFTQDDKRVKARFADGSEVVGDFLIGADGINSVVRATLFGRARPRYSGYTAWRGVTEFNDPILRQGASESWGKGARFGIIPMSQNRVYWFATKNAPAGEKDAAAGRKGELLDLFQGWHEPIERLLEATDETAILRNDIIDREPLRSWTQGRVTLLGDAAHPMTPNLGQGACQAIEDAVVLADSLVANVEVTAALKNYEANRLKRANKIVTQSWRIGKVIQMENDFVCTLRNTVVRFTPAAMQRKQLNWIIEYAV